METIKNKLKQLFCIHKPKIGVLSDTKNENLIPNKIEIHCICIKCGKLLDFIEHKLYDIDGNY